MFHCNVGVVEKEDTLSETLRGLAGTGQGCSAAKSLSTTFRLRQAGFEGKRPAHQPNNTTPHVMIRKLLHKKGSLTVSGDIKGVMCPMFVDTGANVMVVQPDVLSKRTLLDYKSPQAYLKLQQGETANACGKQKALGEDCRY